MDYVISTEGPRKYELNNSGTGRKATHAKMTTFRGEVCAGCTDVKSKAADVRDWGLCRQEWRVHSASLFVKV